MRAGWVYVGSDLHPAVMLCEAPDGRLFVITGTSSDYLTNARGGPPVIVRPAEGRIVGWPGTTHFYRNATTRVRGFERETGSVSPALFNELRKLVGF